MIILQVISLCLISFVLVSQSCEEQKACDKFKMIKYLQRSSNQQPSPAKAGTFERLVTLTAD